MEHPLLERTLRTGFPFSPKREMYGIDGLGNEVFCGEEILRLLFVTVVDTRSELSCGGVNTLRHFFFKHRDMLLPTLNAVLGVSLVIYLIFN